MQVFCATVNNRSEFELSFSESFAVIFVLFIVFLLHPTHLNYFSYNEHCVCIVSKIYVLHDLTKNEKEETETEILQYNR